MSEVIEFFLSMDPPTSTAQQKGVRVAKKNGKYFARHYKKNKLQSVEAALKTLLTPFRPSEPITGPVKVECEWEFPWRKRELKRVTRKFSRIAKTTKPDAANSNKLLIDCMTELGFWSDDSIIFDENPKKFWGDEPGIFIRIEYGPELGAVLREEQNQSTK